MSNPSQRLDNCGVLTTDESLRVLSWDDWLSRATGLGADRVVGRRLDEVFSKTDPGGLLPHLHRVLNEGKEVVLTPGACDCFIPCHPTRATKRFSQMQQKTHIAPIRKADQIVGTIITIEDVTEQCEHQLDLAEQLSSENESIRVAAARELDPTYKGALPALLKAISDPSWRVRRAAVDALVKHHDNGVVTDLLRGLRERNRDPGFLNAALSVLAASNLDVLTPLIELLTDPEPATRTYAALALGLLNNKAAVPALMHALQDPDPNVRYHAIEALGRLRAGEATEELLKIAENRDFFLAYPAIDAIKCIGDASVASRLVPLLEDEVLCTPTAEALGEIGDARAIEPLVALLCRPTSQISPIVHAILAIHDRYDTAYQEGQYIADLCRKAISDEGIKRLLAATEQGDPEEIPGIVRILGWLESQSVGRKLASLLAEPRVRHEVVEALVRHGPKVTDLLLEQLRSADADLQHAAIVALGRIGDTRAVPELLKMLDSQQELLVAIASALARIGDHRALDGLLELLAHPDVTVRMAAIGAINSLGHPDLENRVSALLYDPNPLKRESATHIAGYFGYQSCANRLFELCQDPDENVQHAAVKAIAYLDDPRVADTLLSVLAQGKPHLRAAAVKGFAHLPHGQAVVALLPTLNDPDAWVRYYAAQTLGKIAAPEGLEPLAGLAASDPAPHVRVSALKALSQIGGPRAVAVLASATRSDNMDIATAAIEALGELDHPDALTPLLAALKSGDDAKRLKAAHALGKHPCTNAVAALKSVAETDDNPEVIHAALEALASHATPDSIRTLISLCTDDSRRDTIVNLLAKTGENAVDLIAEGLTHPQPAVRIAIVSALARMKCPRASRRISHALDDPDRTVRLEAVNTLAALQSQEAGRKLARIAATDPDPLVKHAAQNAFKNRL